MISDAKIAANVHVKAGCYIDKSSVGTNTELALMRISVLEQKSAKSAKSATLSR